MTKDKYYEIITRYARKCIELNPDDPTAESMEFANSEIIDTHLYAEDVIKYGSSKPYDDYSDNSKENKLFYDAVDILDGDICKRIKELQLTEKEAQLHLDNGELLNMIDGTIITDLNELRLYNA